MIQRQHEMIRETNLATRIDALVLVAFCGFLFFYGLGAIGLVGADEPRYAQIAREMLDRSDWITPTLQGRPWLEKPVLYYWQAMISFRVAGVSDAHARLPGAVDAVLLIVSIYWFLRRFRPGSEFDGALITASSAAIIGFAHAAATDMPLAATFGIALLCWYAWYEARRNVYLAGFYVAIALGTLAKGPVAPALCAAIIFLFIAFKREWRAFLRTLWVPGIALYLLLTLPWYIAVQMRNPGFFRFFILEHNLSRFSRDVYHHHQPFWFYLPVFLLAAMPWTLFLIFAVIKHTRQMWSEDRQSFRRAENSWPLFLLVWMFVPIVFFTFSQSKLPGYILPSVPAGALVVTELLVTRVHEGKRFSQMFSVAQGVLCGLLIFFSLSTASIAVNHHLVWNKGIFIAAIAAAVFAIGIIATLLSSKGLRLMRPVTLLAVVVSLACIIRFAAPVIDATQSSRPVAESIQFFSGGTLSRGAFSRGTMPVAAYHLNRFQEYGLDFYLNGGAQSYESGNIPYDAHIVVAAQGSQTQVAQLVTGRRVSYLTSIPFQKLDLYLVGK